MGQSDKVHKMVMERKEQLTPVTQKAINKLKLKVGDKVYLKHKAAAWDRDIHNVFKSHTIGGVIQKPDDLDSAIHYYLIGLGQYEYAKILKFNNDASGGYKSVPGVYLEFKFKDGKKIRSWYYLKDVVKMK